MDTIKTILYSFFCLSFFLTAFAAQIDYQDIINQQDAQLPYVNHSEFAQSFNQFQTRKEKIDYLLSLCQKQGDGYKLSIRNIPQKQGLPNTDAFILFTRETAASYKSEFGFYDIPYGTPQEKIVHLRFNLDDTISMIWLSDRNLGILSEFSSFNNLSGSTIIRIFDGLCHLCWVGTVILKDQSTLLEMDTYNRQVEDQSSQNSGSESESGDVLEMFTALQLKILYPYIYGKTFYERYGFRPRGLDSEQYTHYLQTRNFLTHRPLKEIMRDFRDNLEVYQALKQGYNELNYFPGHLVPLAQATIRDALYAPYVRIKIPFNQENIPALVKTQRQYLKLLSTIYENCLESYNSTRDIEKSASIEQAQKVIDDVSYFVKNYGN